MKNIATPPCALPVFPSFLSFRMQAILDLSSSSANLCFNCGSFRLNQVSFVIIKEHLFILKFSSSELSLNFKDWQFIRAIVILTSLTYFIGFFLHPFTLLIRPSFFFLFFSFFHLLPNLLPNRTRGDHYSSSSSTTSTSDSSLGSESSSCSLGKSFCL